MKQKNAFGWSKGSFIWELIKVIVISALIVIPIRYFLVQPFFVRGASMEPNFSDGQYLIIDEIGYRFHEPERKDIIIFKYPNNSRQYYIKRIIGLPGEKVEIKNGQVIIDGEVVDESEYFAGATMGRIGIELADDEYFVMGDNREASSDSRAWGPLKKKFIIGQVWIRAWPVDKMEKF